MTANSSTSEEGYGWIANTNRMREWVGDKVLNKLSTDGFKIKNRPFENTVTVPRNNIEDDQIGIFSNTFEVLGQDAALHPDELVFELLRAGTTQNCDDGAPFFSAAHPVNPAGLTTSCAWTVTPTKTC